MTTTASTTTAARAVTDTLQPRNVLVAGMSGIGWAAAGDWTGLPWGLFGALCAGLVPAGYIEWQRKRGTWGDRHVVDRTKRGPIFLVILTSVGLGALVMILGHRRHPGRHRLRLVVLPAQIRPGAHLSPVPADPRLDAATAS